MNSPTPKTLNDISEFIVDCLHNTAPIQDEGYPLIRTPNIGKGNLILNDVQRVSYDTYKIWTRRQTPQENDLILAREAPAGNVAIIRLGQNVCLGQRTVHIRPDTKQVNPYFLCIYLLSPKIQGKLLSGETGATSRHVNMKDIRKLAVDDLPELPKQNIIASIIESYSILMDTNVRRVQLLEESARLLFREWFEYFKFPGHEKVKIVDGVPEGWKKEKIDKLVTFKRGVEPGSDNYLDVNESGSFPFFRVSDLVTRNPSIFVDEQYAKKAFIKKNDIVVSLDGSVGIVSIGLEGCYSTGIRKLIIKDKKVNRAYLYFLMKSHYLQGVINAYAKGTTIQHAGESIKHIEPILPPQYIMDLFHEIANPILDEILVLFEENQKLVQARDLLLPRLVSGEIEV